MKKSIIILICIFIFCLTASGAAGTTTGYAGANNCQPCHEDQYNSWKSSKHAADFKPEQKNTQTCNACHTTVSDTSVENYVGCEACHGPAKEHIAGGGDKTKIVSDKSADICGRCHNGNQSDDTSWTAEYQPGMKLTDVKGLKLIHVAPDKLAPSVKDIHPGLTYNMWLVSAHAKTPERNIEINGKKWEGTVTCVACHSPHNSANKAMLIMDSKELCKSCHFQGEVLKGFGAKGIEETRSLHTAAPCVACHMTEKNHLMRMFRPDDPNLAKDRLDSCSDCHEIKDRVMRTAQLHDMEAWYKEAFDPVQADLKMIDEKLKDNPGIMNAELKAKLNDVKENFSIVVNDGSNGVHNLDYALEIMSQAKRYLKEIKEDIK